jgi:hypothetical protein
MLLRLFATTRRRVLFTLVTSPLFASACASANGDHVDDAATQDVAPLVASDAAVDARADVAVDARADATPPTDAGAADACALPPPTVTGTGTLTGDLDGPVPPVLDVTTDVTPVGGWTLSFSFHDESNACNAIERGLTRGGSHTISVLIQTSASGATSPFTAGTYTSLGLSPTDAGAYSYSVSVVSEAPTATCTPESQRLSTTGTVTLTEVTATRIAGSFDLVAAGDTILDGSVLQNHIRGSFDAPVCAASSSTATTCCAPPPPPPHDGGTDAAGDAATDAGNPLQQGDAGTWPQPNPGCGTAAIGVVPAPYKVESGFAWDTGGEVMHLVPDPSQSAPATLPDQVVAFWGVPATTHVALFVGDGPADLSHVVLDPSNPLAVYFVRGGTEIVSVSRLGLTLPKLVYRAPAGATIGGLAADGTYLYFVQTAGGTSKILSTPNGGGSVTTVYTAVAGTYPLTYGGQTVHYSTGSIIAQMTRTDSITTAGGYALCWTQLPALFCGDVGAGALASQMPGLVSTAVPSGLQPGPLTVVNGGSGYSSQYDVFFTAGPGTPSSLLGLWEADNVLPPVDLDPAGRGPVSADGTSYFYDNATDLITGPNQFNLQAGTSIALTLPVDALGLRGPAGSTGLEYTLGRCIYPPRPTWK